MATDNDVYKIFRCVGAVQLPGGSESTAQQITDNNYVIFHEAGDNLALTFQFNGVRSGTVGMSLDTAFDLFTNPFSRRPGSGELATIDHNTGHSSLTKGIFFVQTDSITTSGGQGLRFSISKHRDTIPSVDVVFTPEQTHFCSNLLRLIDQYHIPMEPQRGVVGPSTSIEDWIPDLKLDRSHHAVTTL